MVDVAIEGRITQQLFHLRRGHLGVGHLAIQGLLEGQFAHGLVDLLLQLSDAALAGIALDDHLYGGLVEGGLGRYRVKARILHLAGNKVTFGYLYLFLGNVA